MKFFTYKVTFPGMPWYYYGIHKHTGRPYYGSPKTNKWVWKMYDHEIQILEWFDNRRQAEEIEDRIIKHFIKDPNCLNEHYGGYWPEEARERGRKRSNSLESEARREAGKKVAKLNMDSGRQAEYARLGGLSMRGKPRNLSKEDRARRADLCRMNAVKLQQESWVDPDHPELGYHNPGTLVSMQKRRGYPHGKENRTRIS